jgi:hypothetical protein
MKKCEKPIKFSVKTREFSTLLTKTRTDDVNKPNFNDMYSIF